MTILLLRMTTSHGIMRRYRLQRVPVPLFADLPFGERLVGVGAGRKMWARRLTPAPWAGHLQHSHRRSLCSELRSFESRLWSC